MTIRDVRIKVDGLEPNQYDNERKLNWLSNLDGKIFNDVILTHIHDRCVHFTPYESEDDELLVPFPYAEDLYVFYVRARINEANEETAKYNKNITLFNAAYQEFLNYYNRTVPPLSAKGGNRWRF